MKEIDLLDDERIHLAAISTNGKVLTVYMSVSEEPVIIAEDLVLGYVAVTGKGRKRKFDNEGDSKFGEVLDKFNGRLFKKVELHNP